MQVKQGLTPGHLTWAEAVQEIKAINVKLGLCLYAIISRSTELLPTRPPSSEKSLRVADHLSTCCAGFIPVKAGLELPGSGWTLMGCSLLSFSLQTEIWKDLQETAAPLGGQQRGKWLPHGLSIYFTWANSFAYSSSWNSRWVVPNKVSGVPGRGKYNTY